MVKSYNIGTKLNKNKHVCFNSWLQCQCLYSTQCRRVAWRYDSAAAVHTADRVANDLVLIDVKSEVKLRHLSWQRHATTTKSSIEDLRFWHIGIVVNLCLSRQVSTDANRSTTAVALLLTNWSLACLIIFTMFFQHWWKAYSKATGQFSNWKDGSCVCAVRILLTYHIETAVEN